MWRLPSGEQVEEDMLHMARTCVRGSPFSIGKGSMAALKGALREHGGSRGKHEGAALEQESLLPHRAQQIEA